MELRQLTVFDAVVRHGGFTRAAAELHLVQSAVSATIATLERDLGRPLFDRQPRQAVLTPAGEALHTHVRGILDGVRAARDAVDETAGELTGSIRIGSMTNAALFDIPGLLGRFHAAHPAVRLNLAPSTAGTGGLVDELIAGEIDLAFVSLAAGSVADLEIAELGESPMGLAVPSDHRLARRRRIALADAVDLPFVDFRRGFASRTEFDDLLRQRGLSRDVRIESSDLDDLAALVRNGLGVAFLPRYLIADDTRLRWVRLADADVRMYVSVATSRRRTLPAAVRRLAAMARGEGT